MKAGFSHEDRNSQNVDWYTPPWVFQRLGLDFDLDPCQPPDGIDWIPAKRRYSVHDDGLTQPWSGRVWLNPPYGKHTPAWLERMHNHRNGIALVFARTDCAWFHESVAKADAILFLRGRVKFVDGLGVTGGSGAGSGSMLVAWGRENVDALLAMRDLGHLVHNERSTDASKSNEKDRRPEQHDDDGQAISREQGDVEATGRTRSQDCRELS